MVFNSLMVVSVASTSAQAWQRAACMPERLPTDQLLDLVFCFPFQHFSRFALCLWTFLCFPSPEFSFSDDDGEDSSSSSSASSSSSGVNFHDYYYHSHSD